MSHSCKHTTAYTVTLGPTGTTRPRCWDCHKYLFWRQVPEGTPSRVQLHKRAEAAVDPAFKEQDPIRVPFRRVSLRGASVDWDPHYVPPPEPWWSNGPFEDLKP